MSLRKLIAGFRITVPIEAIQKALAGTFAASDEVQLRKGARYALAGEWWIITAIDPKGIRLEPMEQSTKVKEIRSND